MKTPHTLDSRFREAAEREGLVDVAFDVAESPVGDLLVAVTERGLCRIAYRPDEALDELAADFGARVLRIPRRADPSAASSTSTSPAAPRLRPRDRPLPRADVPPAGARELALVPFGQVTTYGALAAKVGKPTPRARSAER